MRIFASNCLPQASTKQTINVRQPNIPEKRVMPCSSLVVLTLAGHPRGSSSTTIQMDKASVDHALAQEHVQIHRFCRVCEHSGQIQAAKLDPCSTRAPFWQRAKTAAQEKAQPSLSWEPSLVKGDEKGSNVLGCSYRRTSEEQRIKYLE